MKDIKVLGPGCAKCKKLAENVQEAITLSKTDHKFEYITEIEKILDYGILMTPGLIIDGKVISTGRLMNVKQIEELLD